MGVEERYEYFFGTNTVKDNKTNQFYGCVVDLLNQQDKRIKELEHETKQLKQQLEDTEEMRLENLNDGYKCVERDSEIIVKLQQENQQLKQQLAISEKALELACERVKYFEEMQDREMGHFEFFGYDNEYDLQSIIEQYKQQAKEMGKNE